VSKPVERCIEGEQSYEFVRKGQFSKERKIRLRGGGKEERETFCFGWGENEEPTCAACSIILQQQATKTT